MESVNARRPISRTEKRKKVEREHIIKHHLKRADDYENRHACLEDNRNGASFSRRY